MSEEKRCGCFGKIVKCVLWCAVVVLILLAAMPLWISPVATAIVGKVVPTYTGTDFSIERFVVNPWTGSVRIGGVRLANPDGFGDVPAFSMGSFTLEASLTELLDSRVHIRELLVEDAFASYYSSKGTNNLELILANVESSLAKDEVAESDAAAEDETETKSEVKLVIDHLRISGTRVKLMKSDIIPALPIATIELRDIGKESGGATAEEVWQALSDAIVKGVSSVGDGAGALGGLLGGGAKDLTSAIGGAAASVTECATSSGTAVGDATKATGTAVGDAVKATGVAIGDGANAAVNAVGDTTKKVSDGVTGFFKGLAK